MINIIVALITGGLTLIGVIYTNNASNRRIENQLVTSQAVTDTKIDHLTNEVKRHNDFVEKIPVLENRVTNVEHEIQELKNNSSH